MKDSIFRAYEEYVLKNKNVEEGLKSLVAGSDSYDYLKCIDLLGKKGVNLSKENEAFIDEFIANTRANGSKKIELRKLFLSYDAAETQKEKNEILDTINKKFLSLNFDYQKPPDLKASSDDKVLEAEEEVQESLLDDVDLNAELEKLYKGELTLYQFSKEALVNIDFDRLKKEQFDTLLNYIKEDMLLFDRNKKFYSTLAKFYSRKKGKTDKPEDINYTLIQCMTIDQLDKLKKEIPILEKIEQFVDSYFAKKFNRELSMEENTHIDHIEKRQNLIKMYNYAKELPEKMLGLKSSLLLEILKNGLKIENYDEDYFIEYLKFPTKGTYVKNFVKISLTIWEDRIKHVQDKIIIDRDDKNLLTAYLEHFFLKGNSMEKYTDYINQSFLTEVWENTMLMSGKKVAFTQTNAARLEKLAIDVRITLAPNNKDLFQIGEDVSVWVNIKNVPKLFIKVFEINTENYYRKNMSVFKTDINLDGLVASIERIQEYKESPQIKFKEELKFPELKGKAGLYVIELIGNGRSSRAVIKIGTLSVIIRQTVAGQLCYMLDGERKICQDESTGIWMDNQYFKANVEKKGRIMLPYLPSGGEKVTKAILLHKGLAQLVDIKRMEEKYTLTCGFHLLPESVLMGTTATALLRPQLLINGREASLSLLKNIRCIIHTKNFIDDISSSKTFSNLTLSDNNELSIKFQVSANLSSIRMIFCAEIQNISKNITETLSVCKEFGFNNNEQEHSIGELYLRLNQDKDYMLYILGKNGEAIKKATVNIYFTTDLFGFEIKKKGIANNQGAIKLGKLKNIKKITADFSQNEKTGFIYRTWYLPSQSFMQYPQLIDILEDEDIEMPISIEHINSHLLLKSVSNENNLENFSNAIKIEQNKNELYGMVKIKGLKSGSYYLTGIGKNIITIQVNKGSYWKEDNNYILKDYSLFETCKRYGFIKIKSVELEEHKDGKSFLKVAINGATKDQWRVHIMLFRYLPEDLDSLTLRLLSTDNFLGEEHFFQKWFNFYLSDRELSSEYRYCFDRRHQAKFIGNTLEKPKLLLKRTLVQVTHTQEGVAASGTEYDAEKEKYLKAKQAMVAEARRRKDLSRGASSAVNNIRSYQNFLALEPVILENLPADKDNMITVEVDKSSKERYGCALILAVDKGSVAHYLQPFPGNELRKRDLSLTQTLEVDKSFCEMRTAKCIEKHDTYNIDDIASTDLKIVDSLEKVMLIINELINVFSGKIANSNSFEKITHWNVFAEEEKNKIVSRFGSHEVYLFICKKDKEYFDKVVKPFIENKMQKTFMDYYLLADMDKMTTYANNPLKLHNLNVLEKTLLVEILALNGKKDLAKVIAKMMKAQLDAKKKNIPEQIKIFDTVLSLGSLKAGQGGKY